MRVLMDELIDFKKSLPGDLSKQVSEVRFVVYAVHPGMRVPLVLDLLLTRRPAEVSNFATADEIVSVIHGGGSEPDLLVVEGNGDNAGVAEMTRKFGCRVYSLGFDVKNIDAVAETLRARGASFIQDAPFERDGMRHLSTTQSHNTGDTFIYVERKKKTDNYLFFPNAIEIPIDIEIAEAMKKKARLKTDPSFEALDHILYRIRHAHLLEAARELIAFTPYTLQESLDADENDTRLLRFRKGKSAFSIAMLAGRSEHSAAEEYVRAHGPRVQHFAYTVADLKKAVLSLRKRGISFDSDTILGGAEEGMAQIYTTPSPCAGDVTEYLERYDGGNALYPAGAARGVYQDLSVA